MKNEDIKRIVKHAEQYDVALRVNYPNGASNSETVPLLYFVEIIHALKMNKISMRNEDELNGAELIANERKRQIEEESFDATHDSRNNNQELAYAAVCYAGRPFIKGYYWPSSWDSSWWKPSPNDRIKELTKAGALIAAEIDRLQREK